MHGLQEENHGVTWLQEIHGFEAEKRNPGHRVIHYKKKEVLEWNAGLHPLLFKMDCDNEDENKGVKRDT